MSGLPVLAKGGLPWPPSVEDFYLPGLGGQSYISKITVLLWIGSALIILFFLAAYRRPKLVPTRAQWIAESIYGFARDGARDMMGAQNGVRFAPYIACLFCFVLITNFWGIIPKGSEREERMARNVPVGRFGSREDVAHAIEFFLDERSDFVTGQVLYVCGDMTVGAAGA